jgi:hypothetical protein
MRVLEDGARRNRTLIVASGTLQQDDPLRPKLATLAPRAMEPIGPAQLYQIVAADFFHTEAPLKFGQVAWVILHSPPHYRLGLHESSA